MGALGGRFGQLIETQWRLSDALRASEAHYPALLARATPTAPAGHHLLLRPHGGETVQDPRMVASAFSQWLFWRTLLARRTPTHETLLRVAHRLHGLLLWQLALRRAENDEPLPLKPGMLAGDVPSWALRPDDRATKATRAVSGSAGSEASVIGNPPYGFLSAPLDWWDENGSETSLTAEEIQSLRDVINIRQFHQMVNDRIPYALENASSFEDAFAALQGAGYSDLSIAQLLNAAWNGQAMLWAGQDMFTNAGVRGAFDLVDPYFYDYLRNQAGYLISGIDATTRNTVADMLWRLQGGLPDVQPASWNATARALRQWSAGINNGLADMSPYRAYMISVTEIARAETFGSFVSMWQLGVQQKIWIVSSGACVICITNAEQGPVKLLEPFPSGHMMPPAHPLCFPAGTTVFGPPAVASTERWYDGDLVELRTAAGNVLSCTPNHPILTPQGWVAAGLLQEGGHVISGTLSEGVLDTRYPDKYQVPASIEDVARALGGSGEVTTTEMEVATEDFHGDGEGSDICVVRSNGLLWRGLDTSFSEPVGQQTLGRRDIGRMPLDASRNRATTVKRLSLPTLSSVSSLGKAPVFLGSATRAAQLIGGALGASDYANAPQLRLNATARDAIGTGQGVLGFTRQVASSNFLGRQLLINARDDRGNGVLATEGITLSPGTEQSALAQEGTQGACMDGEALCQGLDAFATNIRLDRIVEINVQYFSGQVYNLQTTQGWYMATNSIPQNSNGNGIVVHNCRCDASGALSDTFNPNQWQARPVSALDGALFNTDYGYWPNVTFPDDLNDYMVERGQGGAVTRELSSGAQPLDYALATALRQVADVAATRWLATAHLAAPKSEADLRAFTQRPASDYAAADARYLHEMMTGLRRALMTAR